MWQKVNISLQVLNYLLSDFLQKAWSPWNKTKFEIGPGSLVSSAGSNPGLSYVKSGARSNKYNLERNDW